MSFKSKMMRRPSASALTSFSNSPRFSASIRPLSLKTTSPFAALVIFSIHPLLRILIAVTSFTHACNGNHSAKRKLLKLRQLKKSKIDEVLQLANVTRPGVRLKQFQALFVYPADALSCFTRITIDEVLNQQANVFLPFTQRRHLNRENVEPVKEVAPERARGDGRFQIAVSSGNHPNIRSDGSSSTDTTELVFLQNAQKSDLGLGGGLAEFIIS